MKKPDIFTTLEVSLSSALGIVGGAIVQKHFSGNLESWIYFIVAFLLVSTVIMALTQFFTGYLRDRLSFIRSRSRHFIEGYWVQIIDDERLDQTPPTKFSFLKINRRNGEYIIDGRSFNDSEGMQTTNFYSVASKFDSESNMLNYVYKFTTDEDHEKRSLFGETNLIFDQYGKSKCANKYKGTVHSNLRDDVRVLGIKVDKDQNYNFSNPTSRQKVIASIKEAFLC